MYLFIFSSANVCAIMAWSNHEWSGLWISWCQFDGSVEYVVVV